MRRVVSRSVCKLVLSILVVTGIFTVACSSPVEPADPLTITLAPGGVAAYGRLVVTFVGVANDSRCPATALCVHQGDADVLVDARAGNTTVRNVHRINDTE